MMLKFLSVHQVSSFLVFLLIVIAITANQKMLDNNIEPIWSESKFLYHYPDSSTIITFDTDVYEGIISAVQQQFDTTGGSIHYSRIFLTQKRPGYVIERCQISTDPYPAEQPTAIRDNTGYLNIFWGERRIDPRFEQWSTSMPIGMSTTLFHVELKSCNSFELNRIYEGSFSIFGSGAGELRLPVFATAGPGTELHITFGADGVFEEFWNSNATGVAFMSRNGNNGTDEWIETQYLLAFRFQQAIAGSATNHIVLPHIGAPPFLPDGTSNDLYVIHSADGGKSWSDPIGIFTESSQLHDGGVLSNLQSEMHSNGQVHLIWGQNRNSGFSVFPNVMWHAVSTDYGKTWSEPEMFLDVQRPDEDHYHFVRNTSMAIDRAGRLHWAGVIHLGDVDGIVQSRLRYKVWDPGSQSWEHSEVIPTEGNPGFVDLSVDTPENKLYLFWETEGDESFGLAEAAYYAFRNLGVETQLPVVSDAGPLNVHANYPNPFSSSTTIPFTLEEPGHVELNVYNSGGRRIMQKNLGTLQAGVHHERFSSETFSSGVYIYELIVNGIYRAEEKMVIVK